VSPEIWGGPDHYAKGFTVRPNADTSFQGRHDVKLFFLFEEAAGLSATLFETTRTMCKENMGHLWLVILNPTDTTCRAYVEENLCDLEGNPFWRTFSLSAFDHPNVIAELNDQPPPVPQAVDCKQIETWLASWCDELKPGDQVGTDVSWPPLEYCARKGIEPRWFRPGPEFFARALGQWPATGSGVWSDALWNACHPDDREGKFQPPFPLNDLPEVGCDTSTGKAEDYMAIHSRWGAVSLHHETSNTMDAVRIAGRLREVCRELAALVTSCRPAHSAPVTPQQIPIKIDDDGTGNAIVAMLQREGYTVVGVGAATVAMDQQRYTNRRNELWFQTAAQARAREIYLGALDSKTLARLKQQLMAVEWNMNPAGKRVVEPKDKTKEKIGRSPDDADAFHLARLRGMMYEAPEFVDNEPDLRPAVAGFVRGQRAGH
jgi:hypothetical protein